MKPSINFVKSIEENRVVFEQTFFEKIIRTLLNFITTIIFLTSGLALIYFASIDPVKTGDDLFYILIGIASIFIGTIVLINTIYNYKFKIIRGKSKEWNKNIIVELLQTVYENKYNLTEDYIELTTRSILNYQKKIIIVFKDKNVLLKTVYNKNSPFHCCFDKRLESRIRNRIINAL